MGSRRLLAFLIPFLLCTATQAAEPKIAFADGVLTLTTDRYEVTWRDGARLPSENTSAASGIATSARMAGS